MNSVALASRLAVAALIGLIWPALGFAQDWSHHGPRPSVAQPDWGPASPRAPNPRPGGVDRPYRPSYGRWWPGQVLPPTANAVVIADYERFHLRRPPRGYSWLQCDGDFVLTNAAGMIFEVIPGGRR